MVVDGQCFREEWIVHEFSLEPGTVRVLSTITGLEHYSWQE